MINENQIEQIVEQLIERVQKANVRFLIEIGKTIKKIRKLTPSKAQQLIQILKYGGDYKEMAKEIAKYSNLNIKDIEKIFEAYAKKDQMFYKDFYEYRNIPFVPYEDNSVLKAQTLALTNIAKNEMYNFTRNNVLGYVIKNNKGIPQFYGLKETYNRVLDEAFVNISQGTITFDTAMREIMEQIGGSGLKTIEYESGRSIRLDSAARMHLKSRLRELHNENQKIIAKQINADGVEISVHENPAPDHQYAQGHQLYNDEFDQLQATGKAKDINGIQIDMHLENKTGEEYKTHRPISEMNCYHYIFNIIVGVNSPEYTNKQLQEIIDNNNKGFEYEGKHYTNYEGTQLQRNLERKIREQKDIQILGKASGDTELIAESQYKISTLTKKYKELSNISGLPTKRNRLKVNNFKIKSTKEFDNKIKLLYNYGNREENFRVYKNAKKMQEKIINGEYNLNIKIKDQEIHNIRGNEYKKGRSYLNLTLEEEQKLVNKYAGKGQIIADTKGKLTNKERCTTDRIIGRYINPSIKANVDTNSFIIHYSKSGVHIVPGNYRKRDKNE